MPDKESEEVQQEEQKTEEHPEYVTVGRIAKEFHYTNQYISRLCKNKRIKAIKPTGGNYKIPWDEYQRIVKQGLPPKEREYTPPKVNTIKVPKELKEKVDPPKQPIKDEETGEETEIDDDIIALPFLKFR